MQRVATELHSALAAHPDVSLSSVVLRSSWRWTHVKTLPFLASALLRIRKRILDGDVDAVLFSSMVTASLAYFLRPLLVAQGVPALAIVHGRDVTLDFKLYQDFLPRVFASLDVALPVSRATADVCRERGMAREKLVVIPNGVSVARFKNRAAQNVARRALSDTVQASPVPADGLLLLSVGRQVKRKGFAWFIENVLPLLPEDVHYWLVGDGPESENIHAAAVRLGVSHRIRLLGRVSESDLRLIYSAADLFIMPNVPVSGDMEGFGVVMLEAGSSGIPTIAARLEGITDVIRENANGHLVPSGDAWGFSEAIMQYYRSNGKLDAARIRASAHVDDRFGWLAISDRYVSVLQGLNARRVQEDQVPV